MIYRYPFLRLAGGLLLLAQLILSALPACAKGTTIPPGCFWHGPTRWSTTSLLLWSFDTDDQVDLEQLGTEVDSPDDAVAPSEASLTPQLQGDATVVDGGRFGRGVRLAGKGSLRSLAAKLGQAYGEDGKWTLEAWVFPQPRAEQAALVTLPALDGEKRILAVERAPDGTLTVMTADGVLLTHPRKVPSARWTHVALVVARTGVVALSVDGTPATAIENSAAVQRALRQGNGEIIVGRGLSGILDGIHLCKGEAVFCELEDGSYTDPQAQRPLSWGTPLFIRKDTPTVSLSFDGTVQSEPFAGVSQRGTPPAAAFVDGVRGKAMNLSAVQQYGISLNGTGVFPLQRGTLECWVRPLKWINGEQGDEFGRGITHLPLLAFATKAPAGTPQAVRRLTATLGFPSSYMGTRLSLHPGRWYHVVLTWDGGPTTCYINGERMAFGYFALQGNDADYKKWLETHPNLDDGTYGLHFLNSATLLDELHLLPRVWTPEEVANAYRRYLPERLGGPTPLPEITTNAWNDYNYRNVKANLAARQVNGRDPAAVQLSILPKGSTTPLATSGKAALPESWRADVSIPLDLPFGTYELLAKSFDATGQPLGETRTPFARVQPPWWQNTLGVTRTVPKPWTPITVEGSTLKVWNRAIALDATGLPKGLTSAGQEMLAAPIRLQGQVGSTAVHFTGKGAAFAEQAADLARWSATAAGGPLTATIDASMEFDGMQQYTVTLKSGTAPVEVRDLVVDIPLKGSVGAQLIANGGHANFRISHDTRMLPPGQGRVWDSKSSKQGRAVTVGNFLPMIWVGDDDRGLCIFAESDEGWTPDTDIPAQEVIREGNTVIFRMHIICKPVTIAGTRTFRFGLHPTPVKPIVADWRTFNRGMHFDSVDAFSGHKLTTLSPVAFGSSEAFALEPESWEVAETQRKNMKTKFPKSPLLFYIDHDWPKFGPTMAPEYTNGLWSSGRLSWTPEVVDYYVWIIDQYLQRGLIDGLYIDDVGTRPLVRGQAGTTAYALPDGTWQHGVGIYGFRSFLKRVWHLFEKYGKRPQIVAHMTWCFDIPAFAFIEAGLNGEDRTYRFIDKVDFMTMWSRDEMRVMTNGQKFGFVTLWIPEIKDRFGKADGYDRGPLYDAQLYRQARALHAQCLLTDTWYMFVNSHANYVLPALQKFGITEPDVTFLPYWQLGSSVKLQAKSTLVSAWKRPGQVLLFFSNNGEQDEQVTLTIDPTKLLGLDAKVGLFWADYDTCLTMPKESPAKDPSKLDPDGDIIDELEEAPPAGHVFVPKIEAHGHTLTLWVRRHDFRVIAVKPE